MQYLIRLISNQVDTDDILINTPTVQLDADIITFTVDPLDQAQACLIVARPEDLPTLTSNNLPTMILLYHYEDTALTSQHFEIIHQYQLFNKCKSLDNLANQLKRLVNLLN